MTVTKYAEPQKRPGKHNFSGWKRDLPDERDWLFTVATPAPLATIKLSDNFKIPPVVNQGQIGSCTGNAFAYIIGYLILNGHITVAQAWEQLSRLFPYYNARKVEGTSNSDSGASIRDVISCGAKYGICTEKTWPYTTANVTKKPTAAAYREALKDLGLEYRRINNQSRSDMISCLVSGFPIQIGVSVYESFESQHADATGIIPMPNTKIEKLLGGHSFVVDGYDFPSDRFLGQNSWGITWGDNGRLTIPAAYLNNKSLAADFWTVTKAQ